MRRKHAHSSEQAEINMTPMLDVVFILLIFFIVTTSFVKVSGIDVSRPSNSQEQVKPQKSTVIVVRIESDGSVIMDQRKIDPTAIKDNVQKDLAADPSADVVVVANGHAKAGLMVTAIDQARSAGAHKVSIATTGGGGGAPAG